MFNFCISLYILDIDPLSDVQLAKTLFQPVGCLFRLWGLFLNFMQPDFSVLRITSYAIGFLLRKSMPNCVLRYFICAFPQQFQGFRSYVKAFDPL